VQRPSTVIFNGFHRLRDVAATAVKLPRHPCTYVRIGRCPPNEVLKNQGRRTSGVQSVRSHTCAECSIAQGLQNRRAPKLYI
jgi:hypothetical protein